MATTVKVLRKVAIRVETTPGTFLAPNTLMPWTSFSVNQTFDMIPDESIVGVAFMDLPVQGVRKIEGTLAGQVDVDSIEPLLEAAFGSNVAGVFTAPEDKNTKSLSIVALDGVKTNKYAGVFVKSITFGSAAEGALTFSADVVGFKAEVRDGTAFPTITVNPGTRVSHHQASGSGHIRIADQVDALAAGDNQGLSNWELGLNWNFDNQFDNTGQGTLIPLSASAGRPEATFTFAIARHDADTFLANRDAFDKLQAELLHFNSATANIKFEIPNFVIPSAGVNEDDIAGIDIETVLARNGIGSSFDNTNMAFNSPIQVTVDNS